MFKSKIDKLFYFLLNFLILHFLHLLNNIPIFIHVYIPILTNFPHHLLKHLNQSLTIVLVKSNFSSLKVLFVKSILLKKNSLLLLHLCLLHQLWTSLFCTIRPKLIDWIVGSRCYLTFIVLIPSYLQCPHFSLVFIVT